MNLSPAQFPTNSWNPFAAMASKLGGKSKTPGLVSNQEHEGENLQRAIVVGAVQHHFAMKAGAQQHEWSEQSAASAHSRDLETTNNLFKKAEPGTRATVQVAGNTADLTTKARRTKQPATPVKPDTSGGWMEHGPNGRPRRKQP